MTEQTDSAATRAAGDTTTPMSAAWIASIPHGAVWEAFSLSIDAIVNGAIGAGDGIAIVAEGGIVAIVRTYRLRRGSDSVVIYTDGHHHCEPTDPASFGIPVPTTPIQRLDWEAFERATIAVTGRSFAELPRLRADTDRRIAPYLRTLLRDAIADDILGPADGPEELIIGMGVRDRYLVGRLAPRESADEPVLPDDEDLAEQARDLEPRQAKKLIDKPTSLLDPDENDEGERDFDASSNLSRVPSSIGLTCCIDGAAREVVVDVSWGRYERRNDLDLHESAHNKETGKPLIDERTGQRKIVHHRVWKREPMQGTIRIRIPEGEAAIHPIVVDQRRKGVVVQGKIRAPLSDGTRLLTLFLVNAQHPQEENQDETWVFQPELHLRTPGERAIFRRRPILGGDVSDAERISLEMIYRHQVEFAVGHGVSIHATVADRSDLASSVMTRILPGYEVPITEVPGRDGQDRRALRRLVDEGLLDMRRLADMDQGELITNLGILTQDYGQWISERRAEIPSLGEYRDAGTQAMDRCHETLERLQAGLETLRNDPAALEAFRFANRVMADQRVRTIYALKRRRKEPADVTAIEAKRESHEWRPFQLAFLLLSIPALADPAHADRTEPIQSHADLLWFPTGGGKTEAYLGVAAFGMAIRRLKKDLGGLDGSRGLSVIMRYTLRLLTLQQFQRASTLLCAMESVRRETPDKWGTQIFSIGLWVGQKVTPNTTEESWHAIEAARGRGRSSGSTPAQLTSCPWCGAEIKPAENVEVDRDRLKTTIYCSDRSCCWSKTGEVPTGLPVQVVDEEMYRRPPTMLIATVDKFAMMAWKGQIRNLFGHADRACERHGLTWPDDLECNQTHQAAPSKALPFAKVVPCQRIRPPDLIIQDEFHLISGPLGTMVGLYETAVDELCSWQLPRVGGPPLTVRPKVVASSATVRKADAQVRQVFLRRVAVFPPHGLDVRDNFFAVQRPIEERPGRMYLGVCAPGSSRPAVLIRVYTAMLTAAQALFEHFGDAADPWMTAVGYFNSLRELGGMRRLAEDDVQTRCYRVAMSRVLRPGLAQRSTREVQELTSRVSSQDIPRYLDQLEIPFRAVFDSAKGRFVFQKADKRDPNPIDVVLATNMLSVGVDVNRLGLMVVNGQPKSTAEYIQATSRVGRASPGLVVTVLQWSRPRDLSHFETFEHYHATFYKHVEAQSATPFAPRALDRGLTGTVVSLSRMAHTPFNPNLGAQELKKPTAAAAEHARKAIKKRGDNATGKTSSGDFARDQVDARVDEWIKQATLPGRTLAFEPVKNRGDVAPLLQKPGLKPWDWNTVPMSMREVEPGVRLVMDHAALDDPPPWKVMGRATR